MKSSKEISSIWLLLGAAVLVLLLINTFYHQSSGDEGGHLNAIRQITNGRLPVLEYFTFYPHGYTIPYALFMFLFGTSLEAARLFSLVATSAILMMLALRLRQQHGLAAAIIGVVVLISNDMWFDTHYQVRHGTAANFWLFGAFFLITTQGPLSRTRLFLAGAFVAMALNARIPLFFAVAVLSFLVGLQVWNEIDKYHGKFMTFLKRFAFFALGGLLASTPSIVTLLLDPDRFIYNFLLFRLDWSAEMFSLIPEGDRTTFGLLMRLGLFTKFFHPGESGLNWLLGLTVFGGAALILFYRLSGRRDENATVIENTFKERSVGIALLIALSVYLGYMISDVAFAPDIHHAIPFLSLAAAAVLGNVCMLFKWQEAKTRWFVTAMLVLCLAPYLGYRVAYTAWKVVNRDHPAFTQVHTVTQLGCWLEKNTTSETVVFSPNAMPVVIANRPMPIGFEHAHDLFANFWHVEDHKDYDKYFIYSRADFRRDIENRAIDLIIDDPFGIEIAYVDRHFELGKYTPPLKPSFVDYQRRIEANYVFLGAMGGERPYKVYASPEWLEGRDLSPLPKDKFLPASKWQRLPMAFDHLARDLRASTARMLGMSYEARCGNFLD